MLLGLSGKRGSGKDTVARFIQEARPGEWRLAKFADKIKEITALLTGLPLAVMYSQEGKTHYLPEYGMTVGEFQQRLGTDAIRRGLHPETWVIACMANIPDGQPTLITDVRLPNEADAIRARGGVVVRVEGDPLQQRGDGTRDDSHDTETGLDHYPHFAAVIHNTGTLDELRQKVTALLQQLLP